MVKKELSMIAGRLSLKYGKYMAGFRAALLTVKKLKSPGLSSEELVTTFEYPGEQPVKELE